jgi:tetratricopeptide (TPR) repeat protein
LEIATNNPHDADAHYQLGLIYQGRRQYSEAIARFERAIAIDKTEADPYYQLGRIAREQGRTEEALKYYQTAASLDDKHSSSDVWREIGACHFMAGRTDQALAALEKYTARRQYDPEGLYWYGRTLAALGRKQEAREAFQQSIESVRTMPSHRRPEVRRWGSDSSKEMKGLKEPIARS